MPVPPPAAREGTIISACADIVTAVRAIQPGEVPQGLLETGVKQGVSSMRMRISTPWGSIEPLAQYHF
ncbi:MAG: hypothetical protein DPW18_20265 [Chloroflexi bacterium]|nr:hypothetical protein [Chloroflexota bacterium]